MYSLNNPLYVFLFTLFAVACQQQTNGREQKIKENNADQECILTIKQEQLWQQVYQEVDQRKPYIYQYIHSALTWYQDKDHYKLVVVDAEEEMFYTKTAWFYKSGGLKQKFSIHLHKFDRLDCHLCDANNDGHQDLIILVHTRTSGPDSQDDRDRIHEVKRQFVYTFDYTQDTFFSHRQPLSKYDICFDTIFGTIDTTYPEQ